MPPDDHTYLTALEAENVRLRGACDVAIKWLEDYFGLTPGESYRDNGAYTALVNAVKGRVQ